jgi:GNAT superfamily N-acetyltransferase
MTTSADWTIEVLRPECRAEVQAWLGAQAAEHALAQLLKSGGAPTCEFWLARKNCGLLAVAAVEWLPGRIAALVPPKSLDPSAASALVSAIASAARERECSLIQALTELDVGADAELLETAGFNQIADLVYLVSLGSAFPNAEPVSKLTYAPYDRAKHPRLINIIERTYQGTLDCPSLNGLRPVEDVVAGYHPPEQHAADLWSLVAVGGADVGCLLLGAHAEQGNLEIVYVGVVPEQRGHGYGLEMVRRAQWIARSRGFARVVLAVDAANEPALRVYASAGFTAWDRRTVWVHWLDLAQ